MTRVEAATSLKRPWEDEGGCQPLVDPDHEPETAGDMPAQQE
jgi:hypothetical protein